METKNVDLYSTIESKIKYVGKISKTEVDADL